MTPMSPTASPSYSPPSKVQPLFNVSPTSIKKHLWHPRATAAGAQRLPLPQPSLASASASALTEQPGPLLAHPRE